MGLGISAPPMTYAVDGRQYVALLVGWGGSMAALGGANGAALGWAYGVHTRRLVAFSLDGRMTLPPLPPPRVPVPIEAAFEVDTGLAQQGAAEYGGVCGGCHGTGTIASGMAPDLRASSIVLSADAFASVVRDGIRVDRGMPPYEALTDAQLTALRHYIRQQAEAGLSTGGR